MSDSRTFGLTFKEVLLIDSTTVRLFSDILKGVGRNPKGDGKKKGGLKVHMLIDAVQSVGRFIKITAAKVLRDETIELSYHPEDDNGKKLTNQQKTLRLREEAAFERDRYDARKLMSWASQVPQIYTRTSDDVQVAVNSIPHIDPEQPISIGMRIPATGQYTISWPEISGAFPAKSILLEDTQAETTHDLHATQSYTFQADEGNIPERLKLHFSKEEDAITGVYENEPAAASIWYHNNTLYVYSRDQNTEIRLYDINGRLLKHHQPGTGLQSYQIKLPAGVYVVHLTTAKTQQALRIVVE